MSLRPPSRPPALVVAGLVWGAGPLLAQEGGVGGSLPPIPAYEVERAGGPIEVDGRLDEPAWSTAVVIPLRWEYLPADNADPPVETACRMTYDDRALYVGCLASDPRPEAIRARLWERDEGAQDDHLVILIDPFADRRRAYRFAVNPLGVQMDAVFDQVADEDDFSWDAIWETDGRVTEEGYVVEVGIPFTALRFPRASGTQTWGVLLERSWPRSSRHRIASAPRDRANPCLLCQTNPITGFTGIRPGHDVELAPTLTARRTDRREDFPDGELEPADEDLDAGLTAHWGVTPSATLNATVNPDFSQVEADAAQLEVNQRFALFFEEKRPFFLEGAEVFEVPGDLVFTRTVADPVGGAKLTGKEGPHAFGAFATRDRVNNLVFPGARSSDQTSLPTDVTGLVARWRRDVGSSSTLGTLVTSREAEGYHNRLVAADGFLRLGESEAVRFLATASRTAYPEDVAVAFDQPLDDFTGGMWALAWEHDSRNWEIDAEWDHIGRDFRADFGFLPQVDFRGFQGEVTRTFWGETGDPYDNMTVGIEGEWFEDQDGFLIGREVAVRGSWSGPLQTSVEPSITWSSTAFAGRIFDLVEPRVFVETSPTGWLFLRLFSGFGHEIDFDNARRADEVFLEPGVTLRIGRPLELAADHVYQRLSDDGGEIFTANLTEVRALWHFDVRTFVRAIAQIRDTDRDPARSVDPVAAEETEVFTQFLFSYTVNPQTVLFVGYSDNQRGDEDIDLTRTDRTFFFKIGYAWQL